MFFYLPSFILIAILSVSLIVAGPIWSILYEEYVKKYKIHPSSCTFIAFGIAGMTQGFLSFIFLIKVCMITFPPFN